MEKVNVAVVGVGAVGIQMLRILKERNFPVNKIRIFARSSRDISVDGVNYKVEAIEGAEFNGIDIALFAGTEGSKGASSLYARKFMDKGAVVIDNGADFRLNSNVPLIVPEVNKDKISGHSGMIANPNCTTIQGIVALGGIYKKVGLESFILTSFQAVSGAGKKATVSLWEETKEIIDNNIDKEIDEIDKKLHKTPDVFPCQIAFNTIPQIGSISDGGYTSEEWKVVKETHKIFSDNSIKISSTCVRVPVFTSHSEAIYFTPKERTTVKYLENILSESEGVKYFSQGYPLPIDVEGKDEVFVGRLRKDLYSENSFWLWCVSDNLRKGAALNTIQIAECIINKQ